MSIKNLSGEDLPPAPEGWRWEAWGRSEWASYTKAGDARVRVWGSPSGSEILAILDNVGSVELGPMTPEEVPTAIRRAASFLGGELLVWCGPTEGKTP